jgi:hypothetical protein
VTSRVGPARGKRCSGQGELRTPRWSGDAGIARF